MSNPSAQPPRPAHRGPWLTQWLPWLLAAASLVPLLYNHAAFRDLFYFEDELQLVDELERSGFVRWTFEVFGDTWLPLFKVLWSSLVLLSGDYLVLVWAVWLNHALNVALLARVVQRLGGGLWAATLAAVLFGWSWFHFETLGWTLQWMNVLAITGLLAGMLQLCPRRDAPRSVARTATVLFLLGIFSVLAAPRGLLNGLALAPVALLSFGVWRSARDRGILAAAALLPSILAGVLVSKIVMGASQGPGVAAHVVEKLHFALAYFAGSPARWLLDDAATGLGWLTLLALVKAALMVAAFILTPPRWRAALLGLFLLEIGNALLMGIGRFHTGLGSSFSSRYQYIAALATAAALALVVGALLRRVPAPRWIGHGIAALATLALSFHVVRPWTGMMNNWRTWRGQEIRAALKQPPESAPPNFSRLPWIDNERTRVLVKKYDLR